MREISIIKQNILQYLDYKGVSKYEFYQKTGVSNGVLSQKSGISEDNILRFLSYYKEVNPEWLLTGKGEMLKSKKHIVEEPRGVYGNNMKNLVPLLPIEAIAGFGVGDWTIHETDVQEKYLVPDFNGIDFMIKVKGSSMYPKYNSGDIVACRKINWKSFIQWNKPHVISTKEQGIIVKRINKSSEQNFFTLVSDNQAYPPFDIPQEEITGIALIIGVIRLE